MNHPQVTNTDGLLDLPAAVGLVALAILWLALAVIHHLRAERAREWEAHVTSAPGLATPAPDAGRWADEKRGWA